MKKEKKKNPASSGLLLVGSTGTRALPDAAAAAALFRLVVTWLVRIPYYLSFKVCVSTLSHSRQKAIESSRQTIELEIPLCSGVLSPVLQTFGQKEKRDESSLWSTSFVI